MADNKFYSKRLLKISENKNDKFKTVVQVIQWGDNKPTLEKRGYFLKDGEWMCGKASSFNLADFKLLLKSKEEIKEALSKEPEEQEDEDDDDEDIVKEEKKKSKKKHYDEDDDVDEKPKKKKKKHHDEDDDD